MHARRRERSGCCINYCSIEVAFQAAGDVLFYMAAEWK
jgi:hypothetical protein